MGVWVHLTVSPCHNIANKQYALFMICDVFRYSHLNIPICSNRLKNLIKNGNKNALRLTISRLSHPCYDMRTRVQLHIFAKRYWIDLHVILVTLCICNKTLFECAFKIFLDLGHAIICPHSFRFPFSYAHLIVDGSLFKPCRENIER